MHQYERSMPIPDRQRRKLQSALEQYAPLHTKCKIPYGVPLNVQCVYPKGKMMLNCSRSKIGDVFVNPASQPRDSESSDNTSIWSHSASFMSKPSGFWSSNASTRSSTDSYSSSVNKPQFAVLPPIRQVSSLQSLQSAASQPKRVAALSQQDVSSKLVGFDICIHFLDREGKINSLRLFLSRKQSFTKATIMHLLLKSLLRIVILLIRKYLVVSSILKAISWQKFYLLS